jgi:HSP20 family protein
MTSESPKPTPEASVEYHTPDVEIFEDNEALTVAADLPGVASRDLDVSLDDCRLTVTGRVTDESSATGPARAYRRRFVLEDPSRFDVEHITAVLRHGVLELRLPKAEQAKRRQIPVTVH